MLTLTYNYGFGCSCPPQYTCTLVLPNPCLHSGGIASIDAHGQPGVCGQQQHCELFGSDAATLWAQFWKQFWN